MLKKIKRIVDIAKCTYHDKMSTYAYKRLMTCGVEGIDKYSEMLIKHNGEFLKLEEQLFAQEGTI